VEEAIETEKATFCREVLGIGPGDNVVFESGGKPVRIAVTDATVHLLDNDILFGSAAGAIARRAAGQTRRRLHVGR